MLHRTWDLPHVEGRPLRPSRCPPRSAPPPLPPTRPSYRRWPPRLARRGRAFPPTSPPTGGLATLVGSNQWFSETARRPQHGYRLLPGADDRNMLLVSSLASSSDDGLSRSVALSSLENGVCNSPVTLSKRTSVNSSHDSVQGSRPPSHPYSGSHSSEEHIGATNSDATLDDDSDGILSENYDYDTYRTGGIISQFVLNGTQLKQTQTVAGKRCIQTSTEEGDLKIMPKDTADSSHNMTVDVVVKKSPYTSDVVSNGSFSKVENAVERHDPDAISHESGQSAKSVRSRREDPDRMSCDSVLYVPRKDVFEMSCQFAEHASKNDNIDRDTLPPHYTNGKRLKYRDDREASEMALSITVTGMEDDTQLRHG